MKKLFFVGKFNTVYEDINKYLSEYYNIQICVDNIDLMKGMLKLNRPDIAIISLIGLDEESEVILNEFKYHYPNVPVICIGTESEQMHFKDFLSVEQFTMLTRPISNEEIKEQVDSMIEKIEAEKMSENDALGASQEDNRQKCIMFIDDDYVQLRMFYEMFKSKYEVVAVSSAMKVLTTLGKRIPDIIFLDYDMPVCDGKMTLQMIRELDEAKDIPVVFLTGVRDAVHIQAVLELRPSGYLLKPASEDMIQAEIDKNI